MRAIKLFFLIFMVGVCLPVSGADEAHKPDDLAVGKVAPEITGVDVNGKAMKLSDYKGKVVVLDFWGDW